MDLGVKLRGFIGKEEVRGSSGKVFNFQKWRRAFKKSFIRGDKRALLILFYLVYECHDKLL